MWRSAWVDLEAYYPIRPECKADVQKTHFKSRGVHPSIKGLVWEFLLGCYDPNSTFEERNEVRQGRREQYGKWKAECQKMCSVVGSGKYIKAAIITDDGQPIETSSTDNEPEDHGWCVKTSVADKKVLKWMLTLHQIGLDVNRTDRTLLFYESDTNQARLWDILTVYTWVDDDIGYVQGMNDICSPMVILHENEADAFWCFERGMRRLRENFRCDSSSIGVQTQLSTLSQIIKTIDPKLHQHLEDLDGGEYLFAFRMLMVLFRREFSFADALYLWEILADITGNLDARKACKEALKIHDKYLKKRAYDEYLFIHAGQEAIDC